MRGPFLLISAVALGAISFALQGCDSQSPQNSGPLRVLTLNMDRGAELDGVTDDGSPPELRVADFYAEISASEPLARAGRAADVIAQAQPDVVTLQEVLTVRSEYPSDWTPGSLPDAETPRYDVLQVMLDSLSAKGQPYRIAEEAVTADWERMARLGPALVDIRFTERAIVLVREGAEADGLGAVPMVPREVTIAGEAILTDQRAAVALVEGVRVVTFRLDANDEQAASKTTALIAEMPDPTVVAAHIGSDGPTSPLSALTAAGFSDAWDHLVGTGGQTCCRTSTSTASLRRADVVAARSATLTFVGTDLVSGRGVSRYEGVQADLVVQ